MTEESESILLDNIKTEYRVLRDEYIKIIELRQKIVELNLTIFGVILGIALTKEVSTSIALIYPPIASSLAIGWVQLDNRMDTLSNYIRTEIETAVCDIKFETIIHRGLRELMRKGERPYRYSFLSHFGVFQLTQLIAIGTGSLTFIPNTGEWTLIFPLSNLSKALLLIDIVCLLVSSTVLILAEETRSLELEK